MRPRLGGDVTDPPSGCRFHPHCPRAEAICRTEKPAFRARARPPREGLISAGKLRPAGEAPAQKYAVYEGPMPRSHTREGLIKLRVP